MDADLDSGHGTHSGTTSTPATTLIHDPIDVAVLSLASYRLARLMVEDEITAPIRERIWKRFPPESSKVGYLFTCYWCSGVWSASALQLSRIIAPKTTRVVEAGLAAAAVAGLLAAHVDRLDQ